jgi:hypothetical protein
MEILIKYTKINRKSQRIVHRFSVAAQFVNENFKLALGDKMVSFGNTRIAAPVDLQNVGVNCYD